MQLKKLAIVTVFLLHVLALCAQDTILLSPKDYEDVQEIYPGKKHGWCFKQGSDSSWVVDGMPGKGWKKLRPVDINTKMVDSRGLFEGWFRADIEIDSSFANTPLFAFIGTRAAQDIFIDNVLYFSTGNTGINGKPYHEYEGVFHYLQATAMPLLKAGSVHTILWHIKDAPGAPFKSQLLKGQLGSGIHNLFEITSPEFVEWQKARTPYITGLSIVGNSILFILFCLFFLLWLLNSADKNLRRFTIFSGVYFLALAVSNFEHSIVYPTDISFLQQNLLDFTVNTFIVFFISYAPYLLAKLEDHRYAGVVKWMVPVSIVLSFFDFYLGANSNDSSVFFLLVCLLNLLLCLYFVAFLYRTGKKLNRIIISGVLGSLLFISFLPFTTPIYGYKLFFLFIFLSSISFPVSLMIYTAVRFKWMLSEVRANADTIVQLSEEKRVQAEKQQKILKEEVAKQTIELRNSLNELKATQSQLIQSEKMASLGELTAGIAHEIQNPLNFVNNFSEVSNELIDEMKEEMAAGNLQHAKEIADDLKENLSKINHHGKRADSIVKGMLQHSRNSSGQKEPTDLNALCDEYLRLAYHGYRAKDKSFNAKFETHFDPSLPKVNVMTQDIGRVVLNLINNAFYAVNEKAKQIKPAHPQSADQETYQPQVTVSTKRSGNQVEILIEDNGDGIPAAVLNKIFQPFFTTKPTGQGTGLGLSLSYDIVTNGHGGKLQVTTEAGTGTTFHILLPI